MCNSAGQCPGAALESAVFHQQEGSTTARLQRALCLAASAAILFALAAPAEGQDLRRRKKLIATGWDHPTSLTTAV